MDRLFVLVAGATLLAGQVSWSRIATAAVGSTLAASSLTLAAAMAGLGVGALLARRRVVVPLCSAMLAITPWLLLLAGRVEGSSGARRFLVAVILAAAHFPFCMVLPGVAGALGLAEVLAPRWALDDLGLWLGAATLLAGLPMLRVSSATAESPRSR